jgi:hypothetical protein
VKPCRLPRVAAKPVERGGEYVLGRDLSPTVGTMQASQVPPSRRLDHQVMGQRHGIPEDAAVHRAWIGQEADHAQRIAGRAAPRQTRGAKPMLSASSQDLRINVTSCFPDPRTYPASLTGFRCEATERAMAARLATEATGLRLVGAYGSERGVSREIR